MKCVLCKDKCDPENPFLDGAVYERNPKTFRIAWMHGSCLAVAIDDLKSMQAKSVKFESRYDEYLNGKE